MTDRNELERLLAAATEGPWEIYRLGTGQIAGSAYGIEGDATVVCYGDLDDDFGGVRGDTPEEAHANAALICFLRNNAQHYLALMDEVERLESRVAELEARRDALREDAEWKAGALYNCELIARAALGKGK